MLKQLPKLVIISTNIPTAHLIPVRVRLRSQLHILPVITSKPVHPILVPVDPHQPFRRQMEALLDQRHQPIGTAVLVDVHPDGRGHHHLQRTAQHAVRNVEAHPGRKGVQLAHQSLGALVKQGDETVQDLQIERWI